MRYAAVSICILLFTLSGNSYLKDDIAEIKLKVAGGTAKIRPFETAVIQAEFFGLTKKSGLLGGLLGNISDKLSKIQSRSWAATLENPGEGWVSKPFLLNADETKTDFNLTSVFNKGKKTADSKDAVLFTAPGKEGSYRIKFSTGGLSAEITIEVSNSASTPSQRPKFPRRPTSESTDPYFPLVEHYAPFVAQETWFNPAADYLTRFDYDGNWKGDDNWDNLDRNPAHAFVYYAVMETKTHWFLIYNFFHARDYSDVCIVGTCHENDNEGLILTIRKEGSRFGKLEVMETLAHNNVYSFTNDSKIKKGLHDIDGKLELENGIRPIVFIEAGGHGVLGSDSRNSTFSGEKMDFTDNTGVTYVYKKSAESPKHANDRNVGYSLLPIYDHWWLKGKKENADATEMFDSFYSYEPFGGRPAAGAPFISGAFKGRKGGTNLAKPFWGWHDVLSKGKKVLNTGQWALDPAYSVSKNLRFPSNKPVSQEYIFNPYLETAVVP